MHNDVRMFDHPTLAQFDATLYSLALSKEQEAARMKENKDDSDPLYYSNLMNLEGQRLGYLHALQIFRQTFGPY